MKPVFREVATFLKWRLVPVRYLGRLRFLRLQDLRKAAAPTMQITRKIDDVGYETGPVISGAELESLQELFMPRAPESTPDGLRAPFVNLSRAEDFTADNPLIKLAFGPDILDVALDYFGGRVRLDSLQVLHSFARKDALKESQKWHLDYGDSKSLHCVMYLNDVLNDDDGPFVFADKRASKVVGRGLTVRRIEDGQMQKEMQGAQVHKVFGKAGTSIWIDPAACYHYGSRCTSSRTAIFVTFNSSAPFMAPVPLVSQNAQKIADAGRAVRPDLPAETFDRLLGL